MNQDHPIYKESLESLQEKATADINTCREGFIRWVESVRPADGSKGRFNWALKCNDDMPANIASTSYVLEALGRSGLLEEIITQEDKKEGIAWVKSMEQPEGGFIDPVYERIAEKSGDAVGDAGFNEAINRYAEVILQHYGMDVAKIAQSPPPAGFPQLETADTAADWIKMRTWEYDTWRSGALSEKVVYFLYQWYFQDLIPLEPLADAVRTVYDLQDPATGLWSNRSKSNCTLQNRINGSFKLLGVISKELSLPLLHCEKMVDTLLDHMTADYYKGTRSGCDELDNLFLMAIAADNTDNYRTEEVQKTAAHNISLMRQQYLREDGGFSFYHDYCQHNWLGVEIVPLILQGDAMGAGVHTYGLSVAVDLAGIADKVKWNAGWREGWRQVRLPDAERKLKELKEKLSDILL